MCTQFVNQFIFASKIMDVSRAQLCSRRFPFYWRRVSPRNWFQKDSGKDSGLNCLPILSNLVTKVARARCFHGLCQMKRNCSSHLLRKLNICHSLVGPSRTKIMSGLVFLLHVSDSEEKIQDRPYLSNILQLVLIDNRLFNRRNQLLFERCILSNQFMDATRS